MLKTKLHVLTIATLSLFAASERVDAETEIEVQVIELRGELPTDVEVIRMLDDGLLADPLALSGKVDESGGFAVDTTTEFRFASEFAGDGKKLREEHKALGRTLSGTVKRVGDSLEVELVYAETLKTGDVIHKTESGIAIPQPVFSSTRCSSSFRAELGRWVLLAVHGGHPDGKRYLAARVNEPLRRENGGVGQEPVRRESKDE